MGFEPLKNMQRYISGSKIFTGLVLAMLATAGFFLSATSQDVGAETAASKPAASSAFNPDQTKSIEKIVREFLLKHPEILLDVQAALEKKMELARNARMEKSLAANAELLFKDANAAYTGNPKGDVTVVEFFDYNCGYCKRALIGVTKLIEDDKNVKVVFKELPIFGKESEDAARVALAARVQGKYWQVHKDLLSTPGRANEAKALRIAAKHGLDMTRLKADMKSPATTKTIEEVRQLAENMGINGTPHFFVGNRMIPGAPDDLLAQLKKHVSTIRKEGCSIC